MKKQATIRVETIIIGNQEVAILTSNNPVYEKVLSQALVATFGGNYWQEGDANCQTTYYYNGSAAGDYSQELYQDLVNQIRSM